MLFTGSPASAASKANNTVHIVEENEEPSDSDPSARATPLTPSDGSGRTTPTLAEVEKSLSSLSVNASEHAPQKAGAIHPILEDPSPAEGSHPLFSTVQLGVDRRLIVNRKRQLKMYRVWMQGKFRKL